MLASIARLLALKYLGLPEGILRTNYNAPDMPLDCCTYLVACPTPAAGEEIGVLLQGAIDSLNGSGGVILPSGTFNVDTPIIMRKASGGTCNIFFLVNGTTVLNVRNLPATFSFNGVTWDTPVLRIDRNSARNIVVGGGSLSIANPGHSAILGNTSHTGIWIAPANPNGLFGTVSAGCQLASTSVSGFNVGIRFGWKGVTAVPEIKVAASEWLLFSFAARNCAVGVLLEDFNTLDNILLNLAMSANRVGVQCANGGGETRIIGGSSSQNALDFQFSTGGQYSVEGFRSEGVGSQDGVTPWPVFFGRGAFVSAGSGAALSCLINSCKIGRTAVAGEAVIIGSHSAHLIVNACLLSSPIWHSSDAPPSLLGGALTVTDCVYDLSTTLDLDGGGNIKPMILFGSGAPASAYTSPALIPGGVSNMRAFCSRNRGMLNNGLEERNIPEVNYP